jgi:hypothetical protein
VLIVQLVTTCQQPGLRGLETGGNIGILDRRVSRFVDRRGEEELVRALETWVHATPNLVAQVATLEFHDERRLQERLAHLERESPRPGLRRIEHALYCMGILPNAWRPRVTSRTLGRRCPP